MASKRGGECDDAVSIGDPMRMVDIQPDVPIPICRRDVMKVDEVMRDARYGDI